MEDYVPSRAAGARRTQIHIRAQDEEVSERSHVPDFKDFAFHWGRERNYSKTNEYIRLLQASGCVMKTSG